VLSLPDVGDALLIRRDDVNLYHSSGPSKQKWHVFVQEKMHIHSICFSALKKVYSSWLLLLIPPIFSRKNIRHYSTVHVSSNSKCPWVVNLKVWASQVKYVNRTSLNWSELNGEHTRDVNHLQGMHEKQTKLQVKLSSYINIYCHEHTQCLISHHEWGCKKARHRFHSKRNNVLIVVL
jgi:hypothetical protein